MAKEYDPSEIPAVYNLKDVPPARQEVGFTQTVFRGLNLVVGFSVIEPEREVGEPHSHSWEQMNMLLKGNLDFVVGDEQVSLEEYEVLEIPPGVEHVSHPTGGEPAHLLAFWPLREDLLPATEYQIEFQTG